MPFDPKRLRKSFAGGAVLVLVVAIGFYLRGIFKVREVIPDPPKNIPSSVEKSATSDHSPETISAGEPKEKFMM